MRFENTLEFAQQADKEDKLSKYRNEFYIPVLRDKEVIYFAGNGLGLQPKGVQDFVLNDLEDWASFGSAGYTTGRNPWMNFHKKFPHLLADILGAEEEEIVVMDQLTANLHILLSTFYQPKGRRKKILYEAGAFSSDVYVMKSQMQIRGIDPDEHLIKVEPRQGELTIRNEDILQAIREAGEELALVFIGGVHYLTGQVFFMKSITKAAHEVGALCGFDLAHAVGNVELQLNEWEVDFAAWCSYKYLNSGPGGIGGIFIHKNHASNTTLPRLQGWWGSREDVRFRMDETFTPEPSAMGWQLSMAPVLSMSVHFAALELFEKAGFKNLLEKAGNLSSYLIFILRNLQALSPENTFEIVTPMAPAQHGCQITLKMGPKGKHQYDVLRNNGVMVSWWEPNYIRIAPVPLYNSFEDVFYFGKILEHAIHMG